MLSCLYEMERHVREVLLYSARGIFHSGKYNQCIQTPNLDYYLILVGAKGSGVGSINSAMCLPLTCSADLVKSGFNYLLDKSGLPFEVYEVINKTQDYSYPYDLRFFLTLFLMVLLITLVLVASVGKSLRHHPFIGAFSMKESMKVFNYSQGSRMNVFNGIKSLGMVWVVFGHEYIFSIFYVVNTLTMEKNELSGWTALLTEAGFLSVDTFFFVGGFLVAYSVLREKSKTLLKYPLAVLNRYLRFFPSYLMAILIFSAFLMHVVWGPFVGINSKLVKNCDSFWRPLLFVDNLVQNGQNQCMDWGWYMQVDMQLFIYSIFLLFIYKSNRFAFFISVYLSVFGSFAYVFQQVSEYNYKQITHLGDLTSGAQYQLDIYIKPWGRCPPYLYGLLLGTLYHEFLQQEKKTEKTPQIHILIKLRDKFSTSQWFRRGFQLLGVAIGSFICFIPRTAQGDSDWPPLAHSFYLTYAKTVFVVALSMILLPSLLCKNSQSMVRFLLDTKFFNFIAKISFWTYLIHYTVLLQFFLTRTNDSYYEFWTRYPLFISHSVISMFLGFLMVLIVEVPFAKLQKKWMQHIFAKKVNPRPLQIEQQEATRSMGDNFLKQELAQKNQKQ